MVRLVVLTDENRFGWQFGITVHLEEGDVASSLGVSELILAMLHINALVLAVQGIFYQVVIIGGPDRIDRQSSDQPMVRGWLRVFRELIDENLIETPSAALLVDVIL